MATTMSRTAYLLTTNAALPRTQFSKKTLETIGFNVQVVTAIRYNDKVLSNKISMMTIYDLIQNGEEQWAYVFEDDIDVVEPISLKEIVQYEQISECFFYLGCCTMNGDVKLSGYSVNGHEVLNICGGVRGLHAIGLSKTGAKELFAFSKNSKERYMDCILENFSRIHPANVVRFDLQSPQEKDHRGILFQNRLRFPSTI